MLYNAAAHISHSARQHKTVLENFLPVLVVVTVFSVCQLVPTCFEKTAISSLNDSELQTSPPATPGSRGVHVANSHFSKIRARRGKRGCLQQEDISSQKVEEERKEEKGGEREYFGRDRQISIGYAKWAGERLFTVMAGGRWLFPTKHGLQYCLGCRLRFRDVHFTVD